MPPGVSQALPSLLSLIPDRADGTEPTASRSQSLGSLCALVCARRVNCADAVAKHVRDGGRQESLLHGCYTAGNDDESERETEDVERVQSRLVRRILSHLL
jgi:hypothetical protein